MKRFHILSYLVMLVFISQSMTAQDWANFKRYAQANDSVLNAPEDDKRVVLMGNSITQGWSKHYPQFFQNNSYINRGISGQTTSQMLLRFRQDVINLNPKVVVILAGINDIAQNTGPIPIEQIAENIESMADLALAHDIKVILCSVLPADDFPWRRGLEPAEKVIALNMLIKAFADKHNLDYVDYFAQMADAENAMKKELAFDGVHPNGDGYALMESILNPFIEKALMKH